MNDIISALIAWFVTNDNLKNKIINIDYLENVQSYSIEPLTSDPIVRQYVDGGSVRQFQFAFTSKDYYDNSQTQNIANNAFYEDLSDWIETQTKSNNLPNLSDAKKSAIAVEILSNGYLFDNDADMARYQIQLRFLYKKEN